MSWKEFFKPTKKKLLITFLIFISIFVFGFLILLLVGGIEGRCYGGHQDTYCLTLEYITKISFYTIYLPLLLFDGEDIILGFILFLPYSYLLSCLIIFFYNKSKFKKRRR